MPEKRHLTALEEYVLNAVVNQSLLPYAIYRKIKLLDFLDKALSHTGVEMARKRLTQEGYLSELLNKEGTHYIYRTSKAGLDVLEHMATYRDNLRNVVEW
jgi:hypothetical protein